MRVVPLALRRDPLEVLASLAAEPGAFLLEVPDPAQPLTLLGCPARAPRRPRTRLGRAARGGAARAAPPPRALPGRRPPHPRLPGRGRRLPGEPDAALRGAARGARVGALHRARAPPPGAARRLPRRGPGLPPRQLAGALPPPPPRTGRDAPDQGHASARQRPRARRGARRGA